MSAYVLRGSTLRYFALAILVTSSPLPSLFAFLVITYLSAVGAVVGVALIAAVFALINNEPPVNFVSLLGS